MPSSHTQSITTEDFVSSLGDADSTDCFPLVCTVDITEQCSLRCMHCFLGTSGGRRRGALPLEMARELLDRLSSGGVLGLVITGGEPTEHPGFASIWREAVSRGFLVTLFTNANPVDDQLAAFLADHQPRRVEVSVYGHSERTYESVTRVKGSFGRFHRGLDALRAAGLRVHLKFPVLQSNVCELADAQQWAASEDIPFRHDAWLSASLDGDRAPLQQRVDAALVAGLEIDHSSFCPSPVAFEGVAEVANRLFLCGAGTRTMHADVEGNLHPCLLWRSSPRAWVDTGPRQWNSHVEQLMQRSLPAKSRCIGCRIRAGCPCCPALSALETGMPGHEVAFFCKAMEIGG